jgi:putative inorganic carbon (HCO3(-)) transporter
MYQMTTTSLNSMAAGRDDAETLPDTTLVPRRVALIGLTLTVTAIQFSIAVGETFLAVALLAWVVTLAFEHRRPSAPPWMLPLLLYAGWTVLSAALSPERTMSLIDCKQLVLLLLVPLTYEVVDEGSAITLTTFIISAGAVSALIGIGQYSILHYDNLGLRPRSTLGLYMTFAGLVMLVLNVAIGRVLFMTRSRLWPALVIPALAVALPLSLSRNAWVGAGCGAALLLMLRDLRLTAVVPVAGAIFYTAAPAQVLQRFYSIFDLRDVTIGDRFAMMRAGRKIIADHPVFGVGPNMIERVYPQYREPDAVLKTTPHLHNVPLQIAAERGLPAAALWIWFIGAVVIGAATLFRNARSAGPLRFLSAAALASVVSMLAAGMTEHNFGDSEFQILFLVLITLPFAVARSRSA